MDWKISGSLGVTPYRRLVVKKDASGNFSGNILEIAHNVDYTLDRSIRYKKENFTGTVITYDLKLKFVRGGYYEKNVGKAKVIIDKYQSKEAFERRVSTELVSCSWVQSTYFDAEGYFNVVNTWTCIDVPSGGESSGGGSGGGGPSDNPYTETDGPVPGPDSEPQPPLDADATYNVDCSSFDYSQTTGANWQEAGVNRIRLRWVWSTSSTSGIMREVWVNNTVFGLPTKYANGQQLTPGQAAEITAGILQLTKFEVYHYFNESPYFPRDEQIILKFNELIHQNMKIYRGGTAGKTGSGSDKIRWKNEERSNFFPSDCD